MSSTEYKADPKDILFVLNEVLDTEGLCQFPAFEEFNQELFSMVIEEAGNFSEKVLAPLNKSGDREGCKVEDGKITLPTGFVDAWKQFGEGSWLGFVYDPEYGGQGLPELMGVAAREMFFAANPAFYLGPMLTSGAAGLIHEFGSDAQKEEYCEKMFTGEWSGTMCLTEPHAGTALMDVTTSAAREDDHFLLNGTKIFISWGEHDATDNIIHLVLARIPGAPAGVKGISLFIVPKLRADGTFNDVNVVSIEEKMGIHGSPTCVLNFGEKNECHGYLLGQENKGLFHMFALMNEARLQVGVQGLGASEAAYQHALAYANERTQGVHIEAGKNPDEPRTPIVNHPDVQRMLMTMKSTTEAIRALTYNCAYYLDRAMNGPEEQREYYQDLVDLHIPLVKSFATDQGYEMATLGIQVLGGVGFTKDFPLEQVARDVKIASIYEGTNGIQALDLVTRKFTIKDGALLETLKKELQTLEAEASIPESIQSLIQEWNGYRDLMFSSIESLKALYASDGNSGYVLYATPMQALAADVVAAFHFLRQALVAERKLEELGFSSATPLEELNENSQALFYWNKVKTVEYYLFAVLPRCEGHAKVIKNRNTFPLRTTAFN